MLATQAGRPTVSTRWNAFVILARANGRPGVYAVHWTQTAAAKKIEIEALVKLASEVLSHRTNLKTTLQRE